MAHIIELLGNIPPSIIFKGTFGPKYFNHFGMGIFLTSKDNLNTFSDTFLIIPGNLRNITKLKPWPLYNVLVEKYEWDPIEAKEFTNFLVPMLNFNPANRASAAQCLKHPWLSTATDEQCMNAQLSTSAIDS